MANAAIRLPDDSTVFVVANSTRDLVPMVPTGFSEAGDGKHHHVKVELMKHEHLRGGDVFRVGEYAFNRAQAEILFSRLLTLLYGAK